MYTDNGPQFDCAEYTRFPNNWQFEHYMSSPYHSQSNGMVEAAVKTAKMLQKKAAEANRDQWQSFLDYRNTPTEGMDSSPVQRLMTKRTKTLLQVAQHLLEPEIQSDVERKPTKTRRKAKKYFDRGSKELPELETGQPIRLMPSPMDTSRKWRRGVYIKKGAPRSYLVDVKGSIHRRNWKFLRIAKDRLPETVQANRQQLNPETVQANPGTQTPRQQLKSPLTASQARTMIHTQMVSLDNLPVSHGVPAMLQEEPSCSTSLTTTQEEPPPIVQQSPPDSSVIQRTHSGRIINLQQG